MSKDLKKDAQAKPVASRRKFLSGAAAATAGAALAFPMIAKGQTDADLDALAKHVALERHLPRIRARLRQDRQRHDGRRAQDRSAAGRRCRARIRAARCSFEGHARRRSRRAACITTASRTRWRCGVGPRVRHGCQHAARMARWGGGKELLEKLYASIGANVVSFPYGPMATQPLGWFKKPMTKADDFKGLKYRTVGISIDVFTAHGRSGECAARRRNRAGDGPRPARRGRVQQHELRPPARLPGRLEGLHAAKLPPERRAVRDHVQQDQVRCAAGAS